MNKDIRFPISMDWTKDEIVDVVNFFEIVDQVYSKGAERNTILTLYNYFKKVVPSKAEEKQHFKDYEEQTGQIPYEVIKKAKSSGESIIKV
ncbi:UPF0223 family protein [Alkalicoccus saliphilus]|uniref:Uncharacterized protein n=1 Tax=Alkalicoccus saliphilus TaxID=200989 RepID=A0A2T4U287_9BACI|nr:UPF0223 family protein [Alkalicoccus saliphilus]PTL37503.1 hypothetical protein C6Y45_16195 [Alkalicoccus saliphilus]